MDVWSQGNPIIRLPLITSPVDGTSIVNHTNSAAPASAALSNTTPSYTTLGGKFQFAAVAGGETDNILFSFQVPAGFRMWVEGIRISALLNMGATVATTPSTVEWAAAIGAAASLADGSQRRSELGIQSLPVGAVIGATSGADIVRFFDPAWVLNPLQFMGIILKNVVGTATGSQIIRGQVDFTGFFAPSTP